MRHLKSDAESLVASLIATTMLLTSSIRAQPATAQQDKNGAPVNSRALDEGRAASVEIPSPTEPAEPADNADEDEQPATFTDRELKPQDFDSEDQPVSEPGEARNIEAPAGPEPEDVYLFIPRTILLLPRLTLDALFFPVRGLAIAVDKYRLIPRIEDILYNDARTAALVPTIDYKNEYGFTGGAKLFHNDLFGNGEEIALSAEYGGEYQQAYKLSFEGDQVARSPLWLEGNVRYEYKPGVLFWGIGNLPLSEPDSLPVDASAAAVETRFRERRVMASALVGETIHQHDQWAQVGLMGIYNHRRFGPSTHHYDEPSLETIYDTRTITGYESGVDVFEVGPVFVFDARSNEVLTSSGSYLNSFGSYATTTQRDAGYWHYGVTAAGFINLYRGTRILSFRGILEAVHGDTDDIPFTELMRLGGAERLRGYGSDRFRDKLSFVATAEYRYPVHDLVAGEVFVDGGRVGPDYGAVFGLSNANPVRVGGGAGFVVHDGEKMLFKAEAAYGDALTLFLSSSPLEVFSERHKRL